VSRGRLQKGKNPAEQGSFDEGLGRRLTDPKVQGGRGQKNNTLWSLFLSLLKKKSVSLHTIGTGGGKTKKGEEPSEER